MRWPRRGGRLPYFLRYCCSDLLVRSSTSIDFSVCLTVSVLSGLLLRLGSGSLVCRGLIACCNGSANLSGHFDILCYCFFLFGKFGLI